MSSVLRGKQMKSSFFVVTLIVLLDGVGLGLLVPLLPYLMEDMGARPLVVTQLVALYGLAGFVCTPLIGGLSDRYGRKRIITLTLLGTIVSYAGMLFSTSLAALFLFRALGGAMVGRGAVAQALATDSLRTDDHVKRIGIIGAAQGVGMVTGPIIGGLLSLVFTVPADHYQATFVSAAVLTVVTVALAVLALREPHTAVTMQTEKAPGNDKLWSPADIKLVIGYLVLTVAISYAFGVCFSVTALYVERAFNWGALETGWILGLASAALVLSRMVFARKLHEAFGLERSLASALLLSALALYGIAAAEGPVAFVLMFIVFFLGYGVSLVFTTSVISLRAANNHRGRLLGLNQSASALALALSASTNGFLFDLISIRMPFIVGATALIIPAVIFAAHVSKRILQSALTEIE